MSYIRMLPHYEIHSAMQGQLLEFKCHFSHHMHTHTICINDAFITEAYWLQREHPQGTRARPGSQGGEKLTFD
jgi:hypothetical protein